MTSLTSRNITITILVVCLLGMVLIIKGRSPFGKEQSSFASSPKKNITKIEIAGNDKKLVLSEEEGRWMVNGRQEARKSSISFLLEILKEMKIKSPVSPDLFKQEIAEKKVEPLKVRVYEHSRLIKMFYVYPTTSNKYGNIMKISERSKPFIVYLPGFEDDIGSLFILNENFWKPFTVFELLPSEIYSITLENRDDPALSFRITYATGRYTLSDLKNDLAGWDTSRVKRYISYFTHVSFENWIFSIPSPEKQRLENEMPDYILTVRKNDGTEKKLSLWKRDLDDGKTPDRDRMWGRVNDSEDFFIIRYFDVDPVIKKYTYFFGK